ncbi:MAG: 4-hydroxy-tetrahydrodipicolinate synthase [bacterium]|nr:4-hydroxy-tetrahydrodipicolinate synthase [bacterium]
MLRIEGIYTALVTPFANGTLDESRLRSLIAKQIDAGIHGVVIAGTTGEGPVLDSDEWEQAVRIAVTERGSLKIIANAGTNNTMHSIEKAKIAEQLGADAILVITPYYNKPTQNGMIRHFEAVANATKLPVMLYNVPSRTGCELLPDSCLTLLSTPNIVSIKQAVANLDRFTEIRQVVGNRWTILSGEDSLFLPMLGLGADGIVSVLSNVAPNQFVRMYEAAKANRWQEAQQLHYALYDLMRLLFIETSPAPVKAAMRMIGEDCGDVRLPLVPLSDGWIEPLRQALLKAREA